jgi:hypothetical protein
MFDSMQVQLVVPASGLDGGIAGLHVSAYSHSQAIADGLRIDVTPLARELGFKDAVVLTRNAFEESVAGLASDVDDLDAQLASVLFSALSALRAQSHRRLREVEFTAGRPGMRPVDLRIVTGPGDRGETVLTIQSADD